MRYRLRTLMILLALGPPLIWGGYLGWKQLSYMAWERRLQEAADIGLQDWLIVLGERP